MRKSYKYKTHPLYPDYRIYGDGRIQNIAPYKFHAKYGRIDNGWFLTFKKHRKHPKWGHLFCSLVRGDGKKPDATVHVHKIVAQLFVPNPERKLHVIHVDGNKKNNHYTNLKWVSQADINYIQYESGKRDPIKEARNMRKNGGIRDWSRSEIKKLLRLRDKKNMSWKKIVRMMKGRTIGTCQVKYSTYHKKLKLAK